MKSWWIENFRGELDVRKKKTIDELCAHLRPQDAREIHCYNKNIREELLMSQKLSEDCYMVMGKADEKTHPLVFFGRIESPNTQGVSIIWCVATKHLIPFERDFARVTKKLISAWAKKYGLLFNAVAKFNLPALRWLSWCGAEFGEEFEQGGEKFIRFRIEDRRNEKCAE